MFPTHDDDTFSTYPSSKLLEEESFESNDENFDDLDIDDEDCDLNCKMPHYRKAPR